MRNKWLWLAVVVLAIGGLATVNAIRLGASQEVTLAAAETGVIAESVFANGRLRPAEERTVFAGSTGTVSEVHVKEGDSVKAGDPIATYDTEDWERQLAAERNQSEIAKLQREAERRRHFNSVRGLTDQSAIDEALSAEETAGQVFELQQRSTEWNIERLEQQIENRVIRSPFAGVVTSVSVKEGSAIPQGFETAVVADMARLVVEAALNELDAGKVRPGMEAIVTGDAFEERYAGALSYIAPEARPAGMDGLDYEVPVKVALRPAAGGFGAVKPGFAATVEFVLPGDEQLLVPLDAVAYVSQQAYVFRIGEDGLAVRLPVTVGKDDGERIEITDGAEAGMTVISPIPDGLREGDRVKAAEPT